MPAVSSAQTQSGSHPMKNYVRTQLQNGADLETIVSELGKSGVEENMARRMIESVQQEPAGATIAPPGETPSLQMALLGGVISALVAGAIWGGIIIATGWELGLIAWFVGGAVGYGILIFSKGESGPARQYIAVLCSVFGILIGKYFAFYVVFKEWVAQELGPETAANMSVFSLDLFGQFMGNLGEVLGPYDLLWIGLACVSAWKITSAAGD